jgi:hypothetical protein
MSAASRPGPQDLLAPGRGVGVVFEDHRADRAAGTGSLAHVTVTPRQVRGEADPLLVGGDEPGDGETRRHRRCAAGGGSRRRGRSRSRGSRPWTGWGAARRRARAQPGRPPRLGDSSPRCRCRWSVASLVLLYVARRSSRHNLSRLSVTPASSNCGGRDGVASPSSTETSCAPRTSQFHASRT